MRMKIGMNVIEGGHRFCIGFFLAFGLIWTDSTLGDSALFLGRQYAVGSDPISVAIGDLNGDQVPDMAVANRGWRRDNDGNVAVRLGLGDGTFATAVKYAFGNAFTSIAIGDLDGDSVPDLAVANQDDDNVSVLLGLGDGTFSDGGNFPAGDGPQFVTIGDLNGDQVPDLAVASSGTDPEWDGNVAVLLGVGDGTFAVAVYYAAGISPRSIAIGDLDGDHVPDLAVASSGMEYGDDASVSVLIGVGDGTFSAAVPYAVGTWARSVAIGDLNDDQVPDLAVANRGVQENGGNVSVLLGVGDGTFAASVNYLAGSYAMALEIGDLDGDEVPDLAVANYYADAVSVLRGIGDGTFAERRDFAAGDGPQFVAIGDLDGDEVPDLTVANRGKDSTVSVLLGVGDGTPVAAVQYATGHWPTSTAIGDLNGDEVPDLAVSNRFSDDVSVLLGVGDGTFAAAANYFAGDGPRSVAIGDLDGDHVPDLAVAGGWQYPDHDGRVSVLFGVGDGTFAAAVYHAVGNSLQSVAIGDLDGDEVLDLAVASSGRYRDYGTASVLLGVGDGTFAVASHYVAGISVRSVAIGDLDGDGVPDLAVASNGTYPDHNASVSVFLGKGDGTFVAAVNYSAGAYARSVAIGDLDGDGVPDLAVAKDLRNNVSVLLGVGDGTFTAAKEYAAGRTCVSIAIGDLDGDQMPDLAVANFNSGTVSVLLNQYGDCNRNGIPDECDVDCGPAGGPCDIPGCGQSEDCNSNGEPDDCEADCDGDGLLDDCDACPDSDLAKLITVEKCLTSVTNELLDDGCTMNDVLAECALGAHNHGQLTACVARNANEWRRQGLLSVKDVGRITHCAGSSNEHRPSKRVKDVRTRGRR